MDEKENKIEEDADHKKYNDNHNNKKTILSLKGIFFCHEIYRNDDLNLRKEIKPVERVLRDGDTKWASHFHI